MKVTKKISVGGNWAKVGEHINDGDRLKLLDGGQIVSGEFGDRRAFKILTMNREEFNLSFNQTSMNNLIDAWGDETDNWKDKIVKVFVVKQMIEKKLKNVAYLAPENWTMNQDGEFVNPEKDKAEEYPKDDINPDDIPF